MHTANSKLYFVRQKNAIVQTIFLCVLTSFSSKIISTFLLPLFLKADGIWIAMLVSEMIVAIIALRYINKQNTVEEYETV